MHTSRPRQELDRLPSLGFRAGTRNMVDDHQPLRAPSRRFETKRGACASCRGAACSRAGRDSTTADDRLRKGAREVFEITNEELFVASKIGDAYIRYSFPYDQTNSRAVPEKAEKGGVPLRWVECLEGAFVLFRLGLLVFALGVLPKHDVSETVRGGRFLLQFLLVGMALFLFDIAPTFATGASSVKVERHVAPEPLADTLSLIHISEPTRPY